MGRAAVVFVSVACSWAIEGCGATPGASAGATDAAAADSVAPDSGQSDANVASDSGAGEDSPAGDATGADGSACPPPPSAGDGGTMPTAGMANLVPMPVSVTPSGGTFVLPPTATIRVDPPDAEMTAIGEYLAQKLRPATGYALPVVAAGGGPSCAGDILVTTTGGDASLGDEGYDLAVTQDQVHVSAYRPAGTFRALQTLRQLFPPAIESATASAGPWGVATGTIHDYPRFPWRGTMLDVARHFFGVNDVEAYIDLLAYYKVNTFHIHLSDDQGWRIVVDSWPNLTAVGGTTEVGGGAGGFYSQADYSALVAYAQARYITVVPEIDMPGHTTAALTSYASLNCNGMALPPDTGTGPTGSSLCVSASATYTFVGDVISEVAGLSPGPYFHLGGDEATGTSAADFQTFFGQVEPLVQMAGKQMVGWDAVGQLSSLPPGTIVQFWAPADEGYVMEALGQGAKILMSPASVAYMDMKYDTSTMLGQTWAGYIDEQKAYSWDPATMVTGVTDPQLVGLEAPLWSETLVTLADVEYMAFPRIIGYAEIGWSPSTGRSWDEYKVRLGSQGPRLGALGVNYHMSALVPWQ